MKTSNAIPGFCALRMKEDIQRKKYEDISTSDAIPGFSALRMKEVIQREMYEITKDMTWEEQKAYYKSKLENDPILGKGAEKTKTAPAPKRVATRKKKELA